MLIGRKKIVQFLKFLICLVMTNYTTMQKLFANLNVPNNPMKHWFDGVG
jgi:hypothetical protein